MLCHICQKDKAIQLRHRLTFVFHDTLAFTTPVKESFLRTTSILASALLWNTFINRVIKLTIHSRMVKLIKFCLYFWSKIIFCLIVSYDFYYLILLSYKYDANWLFGQNITLVRYVKEIYCMIIIQIFINLYPNRKLS